MGVLGCQGVSGKTHSVSNNSAYRAINNNKANQLNPNNREL